MRKMMLVLVVLLASCQARHEMIETLVEARENLQPFARPTVTHPALSWEQAYDLQDKLVTQVEKSAGKIVGYKLSPGSGRDPKTNEKIPVYGRLFQPMLFSNGATIEKKTFIDLHLENEIAFIIGKDIPAAAVKTKEDLKPYVAEVAPAIELPDVRFSGDLQGLSGKDLIVDNVAAAGVILGDAKPLKDVDVDTMQVTMNHNGTEINRGDATMVWGSPWNTLLWLVKKLDSRGHQLRAGQVVITGAIGKFLDGKPGQYQAKHSQFDDITFSIVE